MAILVLGAMTAPVLLAQDRAAAAGDSSPAPTSTGSSSSSTAAGDPTPTPTSTPGYALSLTAPAFSPTNAVQVSGKKDAGSSVAVTVTGSGGSGSNPGFQIPADSSTTWNYVLALQNGAGFVLSGIETLAGSSSPAVTASVDVLGPPTIDGAPGEITSGLVSGYSMPRAAVTASAKAASPEAAAGACTTNATAAGYWSCALGVPSGNYIVSATQSLPNIGNGQQSSGSGTLQIAVDKNAPAVPSITWPTAGLQLPAQITVTGTGENGATADVYLDNATVCETTVSGGTWRCTVSGIAVGNHSLIAIQRDAAGNYSTPSAPVSITVAAAAGATIAPAAPSNPKAPVAPIVPKATPTPTQSAETTPDPYVPPTEIPSTATPNALSGSWGAPTHFGSQLPSLASSVDNGNWLIAPLLALGFILLIALPLRLLTTVLAGRFHRPRIQLTGRNRPRESNAEPQTRLNPWLLGLIPLGGAAALIVYTGGVDDGVRYLRLTFAVVLGLAVLNLVGVVVATRLGSRMNSISGRLRFLPPLMVVAAIAALLSRWSGIQPPAVIGVIVGVTFAHGVATRSRAIVSLIEVGSLTALATAAWLVHGAAEPLSGFWGSLLQESLATVAIAGFGSVALLILPIGSLPGRVIFEWSRSAWLGAVIVVTVLCSVITLGGAQVTFPVLGLIWVASGFAIVTLAIWGWVRFVEGALMNDA